MRSIRLRLGVAVTLLVGVGVACGGGSNGGDDSTDLDGSAGGDGSFSNDASSSGDGSGGGDGAQGDDGSPSDGGGKDTGSDVGVLNGTLTVHASQPGYAIIGDGTKLAMAVTGSSQTGYVATFNDPSLVGPQNVTFVVAGSSSPNLSATTYVGVTTPDVTFGALPSPAPMKLGNVSGSVEAYDASFRLASVQTPLGYSSSPGYAATDVTGHFSIPVSGPGTGPFDLVVGAVQNPGSLTVAAGAVSVTMPAVADGGDAATIVVDAGQNLVLDHPYDQSLTIDLADAGPDGSAFGTTHAGANLAYLKGYASSSALANTYGTPSTFPFSIPSLQLTAPFDTWERSIDFAMNAPPHYAHVYVAFPAAVTTATVTLPSPPAMTSPAPNPDGGPSMASHTGLTFAWQGGAGATISGGSWSCKSTADAGAFAYVFWNVFGAGSSGSFAFPALPADAGTNFLAIPPSTCQVSALSKAVNGTSAQDVFHESEQRMSPRFYAYGGVDTFTTGYSVVLQ